MAGVSRPTTDTFDPKKRSVNTGVTGKVTTLGAPATPAPVPVAAKPTKTLQQAVQEFQAANPVSVENYQKLIASLNTQGYRVAQTTHANNTLASSDAIVDDSGNVYDLAIGSNDPAHPYQGWSFNPDGTYDAGRSVVGSDGKFLGFSDWQKQSANAPSGGTVLGNNVPGLGGKVTTAPLVGKAAPNFRGGDRYNMSVQHKTNSAALATGLESVNNPSPTNASTPTPPVADPGAAAVDAYGAAARARKRAAAGGRQSTILGGFMAGSPSTSATVLGGY